MIYLGLDQGAYNLVEKDVTYKDADGNVKWIKENQTVWNDTTMNGKIYFHTGDKMTSAEYSRSDGISRSVKFLWAGSGNNVIEDTHSVSREMTLQRLRKRNWRTFYMPVIRLLRLMISIACPIK